MREQDWEMLADITGDSIEPDVTPRSDDSVRVALSDVRQRRTTLDDLANIRWPDMSIEELMQICDATQASFPNMHFQIQPAFQNDSGHTADLEINLLNARIAEQERVIDELRHKVAELNDWRGWVNIMLEKIGG